MKNGSSILSALILLQAVTVPVGSHRVFAQGEGKDISNLKIATTLVNAKDGTSKTPANRL